MYVWFANVNKSLSVPVSTVSLFTLLAASERETDLWHLWHPGYSKTWQRESCDACLSFACMLLLFSFYNWFSIRFIHNSVASLRHSFVVFDWPAMQACFLWRNKTACLRFSQAGALFHIIKKINIVESGGIATIVSSCLCFMFPWPWLAAIFDFDFSDLAKAKSKAFNKSLSEVKFSEPAITWVP